MFKKKDKEYDIPKGKDFKSWFRIFLAAMFIGLIIMIYFFVRASKPDHNYSVAANSGQDNSSLVESEIQANQAMPVSQNMLHQDNLMIAQGSDIDVGHTLQAGDYVLKNGKLYRVNAQGQLVEYKGKPYEGMIAYQNGQKMRYENGHWVPVANSEAKPGDFVMRNGKLYRVNADGSLTPYKGKLHDGDKVWKNGKEYMYENGKLIPFNKTGLSDATLDGAQAGDLVMKDGKLYQMGKDGKLHLFHGKPKVGQYVWKNGKAYIVGADGKLHAVKNGAYRTINGKPYVYENGKWVPLSSKGMKAGDLVMGKDGQLYQVGPDGKLHKFHGELKEGQIVWKNGKPYIVGADGKLRPLKEGETFIGADGQKYTYQNGRIVPVTSNNSADKNDVSDMSKSEASDAEKALLKAYKSEILVINSNKEVVPSAKAGYQGQAGMKGLSGTPNGSALSALNSNLMATDPYAQANNQSEKSAFLNGSNNAKKPLPLDEIKPLTPYTITAGTILPATLVTGMNSDLPGSIQARVSQNVYDTVTGNYLLVPQGSVLNGVYDSNVSYGQTRVMMVWQSITFPNGNTVNLGGMPGADLQGYMGIQDQVDNHYWKVFSSAALFSVFGAASQLTQSGSSGGGNGGPSNSQIVYAAVGQQLTQTAQQYLQKDLNIQPTLKIRPGANFQVYVTRNLSLNSAYNFN